MSTPQRSYYEIALTNRQVLIAFSILLGCVISAFVSGLWVGRQAAERRPASAETGGAAQTPADGTYRFFGDDGGGTRSEGASAGRPQGSTAPTAEEPGSGSSPQGVARSEPMQTSERERAGLQPPTSTAVPSREKPAQSARTTQSASTAPPPAPPPVATAVVEPEAESTSAPDQEAPSPEPSRPRVVDPPPSSELSVIQVFSSADEPQARAVLDRLKGGGFRAFLSPVQVDGRTMYRVRVGPFRERAAAEREAERLKQLYKLDTWITN